MQARKILPPVYGWFTGGLDRLELRNAKALLYELNVVSLANRYLTSTS